MVIMPVTLQNAPFKGHWHQHCLLSCSASLWLCLLLLPMPRAAAVPLKPLQMQQEWHRHLSHWVADSCLLSTPCYGQHLEIHFLLQLKLMLPSSVSAEASNWLVCHATSAISWCCHATGAKAADAHRGLVEQLFVFISFFATTSDFYNSSLSPWELTGGKSRKQTL